MPPCLCLNQIDASTPCCDPHFLHSHIGMTGGHHAPSHILKHACSPCTHAPIPVSLLLQGLEPLTKLRILDVSSNRISVITGLSTLTQLEDLWANDNGACGECMRVCVCVCVCVGGGIADVDVYV